MEIGDNTVVREYVTIHRSAKENEKTLIGKDCLLMAYAHIAHDCRIHDHVIIVNSAGISGHVVVEEHAFVSGIVGVHQFIRIGKYSMTGGMTRITQNILPFSMVEGNPARLRGINAVGLRRSDFSPKERAELKKAIKLILQPELNTSQAIEKIETEIEMSEEIRYLVNFIKKSDRGIVK